MQLADLIEREAAAFRTACLGGEAERAWAALERMHILSQPFVWPHVRVHLLMLGYALKLWDWREARGQAMRLVLAPIGNLSGRLPIGNTGRSDVSAFDPMPIPDDLRNEITLAKMR